MKVKKIKERIEMSLKLLESLESSKRSSDEGLSLDVSYSKKTLVAAYQKIEQQQEKIAELESENKSLKHREEHEYEEEFAGPAMG